MVLSEVFMELKLRVMVAVGGRYLFIDLSRKNGVVLVIPG